MVCCNGDLVRYVADGSLVFDDMILLDFNTCALLPALIANQIIRDWVGLPASSDFQPYRVPSAWDVHRGGA